jgi:hypothetical protein
MRDESISVLTLHVDVGRRARGGGRLREALASAIARDEAEPARGFDPGPL